jgi:hypothetical protein
MVRKNRWSILLFLIVLLNTIWLPGPVLPVARAQEEGAEWIFHWNGRYTDTDNEDYPAGVRSYFNRTSTTQGTARLRTLPNRQAEVLFTNHVGYAETRLQVFDGVADNCFALDDYEMVRDPALLSGRRFTMSFDAPVQQPNGTWQLRLNDTLLRSDQARDFPSLYSSTYLGFCRGGNYDELEEDTLDVRVLSEFDRFIPYLESVNGDDFFARANVTVNAPPDQYGNVRVETFTGLISARRVTCPAGNGPFRGNDADLRALELEIVPLISPTPLTGTATTDPFISEFAVYATCKGIPVVNADLTLAVEALEGSGGHRYHEGRPHGSINGLPITAARRSVAVTTDRSGHARFTLEPAKDTRTGRIMIAGEYRVQANAVRYPDVQAEIVDSFKVGGLEQLQPSADLVKQRTDPFGYQDAYNATPITNQVLQAVAADYRAYQQLYNDTREASGKPREPLVPLEVNDISLPWGGLFPTIGWDEQQGRVTGKPWQPPHYTHTDGTVVDISLSRDRFAGFEDPPAAYIRHRLWLRELLASYGQALSATTLTYRLRQTAPATLMQTSVGTPDLLVDAFIDREVPAGAPGQVVPFSLSIANVAGNVAATGTNVRLTLPVGISFEQATPPPTSQNGQTITWSLGGLAVGAVIPVRGELRLGSGTLPGTQPELIVVASSEQADITPANNQIRVPLTIQPIGPDLVLGSNLQNLVLTGEKPVTVTLNLANVGNVSASGTQLQVTLPLTMQVNTGSKPADARLARELRWDIGELAPDQSQTISFGLFAGGAGTRPITFTLAATTTATDIDLPNNQQVIVKEVERATGDATIDLTLSGAVDGGVRAGQPFTITLDYGNNRPFTTGATTATLQLDAGLRVVAVQPAPNNQTAPTSLSWSLGALAANASGQVILQLQADSLPTNGLFATARLATSSQEHSGANNSDRIRIAARPAAPPPTLQQRLVYIPLIRR